MNSIAFALKFVAVADWAVARGTGKTRPSGC